MSNQAFTVQSATVKPESNIADQQTNAAADPIADWTPADFMTTAKATADVLCSHVELALSKDSPAAIRFREDVNRLLEQIELEVR